MEANSIRVGDALFSLSYARDRDHLRIDVTPQGAEGFRLNLAPALGLGIRIKDVTLRGESIAFEAREAAQVTQALCELPVHDTPFTVMISFEPSVEVYPLCSPSRVGAANSGLKILSLEEEGDALKIEVEGLSGEAYELGVLNAGLIASLEGGEVREGRIHLRIPEGEPGKFLRHTLLIRR